MMGRLMDYDGALVAPSEPVLLEATLYPTDHGKRWMEGVAIAKERHADLLLEMAHLAEMEKMRWPKVEAALRREGVPTAVTNGLSQYAMGKLIDHVNGKTSFTMPTTVALALATAAPSSTTTGTTLTEANYTGYARVAIAAAGWNAATAATPSVATNASTITFGNCTAGSSALAGFILVDSSTTGGNSLWYGTLTAVTINTTQTPPTVAAGALSVQINST